MISPSESAAGRGRGAGLPVRLLGEGERGVSRLEFVSLDRPEIVADDSRA